MPPRLGDVTSPVDLGPGSFAEHTSLRVGGVVGTWIVARTEAACIEAIVECDDLGRSALVLGGGSNVVCSDAAFDGTVVQVAPTGITSVDQEGLVRVVAAAGEEWDELVLRSLAVGSAALAPLSGIPGLVGASPIQNVGAYGVEVADYLVSVRVWDRTGRSVQELSAQECGFGYRTSRFKQEPDRFVVLEVAFDLPSMSPCAFPTRNSRALWVSTLGRARTERECVRRSWSYGAARAWCSTSTIAIPGALAPSSLIRSSATRWRAPCPTSVHASRPCRPRTR